MDLVLKGVAEQYAVGELGRKGRVVGVVQKGTEALALYRADDDGDDFVLALAGGTVADEVDDPADFFENGGVVEDSPEEWCGRCGLRAGCGCPEGNCDMEGPCRD